MSIRVPKIEYRFPKLDMYDEPTKVVNYAGALRTYASELCSMLLGPNVDPKICIQEVKPAADCIIRSKQNKMGLVMNNLKVCECEIELMKHKISKKYDKDLLEKNEVFPKIDAAFYELHNQMKAFV